MAEKLCTLRTKGGGGGAKYTETSLWTNPSPSADFVADTTVTLSQGMSNFKYIKITWARTTTELSNVGSVIYPVEDFVRYKWGTANPTANIGITNTSNAPFARTVIYVSDTKIKFGINARINYANTTNTGNIPLTILGLNELDHGIVATIPEIRFSAINTNGRCYGMVYLDVSKYKSMTYTLGLSNASFASGQYIRVDNNGTAVQEMGKTAGTYTINFDDSWTGDNYRLSVIATPSAAYGYVSLSNIIFTLKDN